MHYRAVICIVCLVFLFQGCGASSDKSQTSEEASILEKIPQNIAESVEQNVAEAKSSFQPFIVYQDQGSQNRYIPSGYMPNGECVTMNTGWRENCVEGEACIQIKYDIDCSMAKQRWAGVYWLNPPDNWGQKKGGYDLTGAKVMKFWAKGELGGERIEEFKIGGVGNTKDYPDTDSAMIGPVILSDEWREYEIDLRGKDLSYIAGGFAWVANALANPEHCVFYLDHIRFE